MNSTKNFALPDTTKASERTVLPYPSQVRTPAKSAPVERVDISHGVHTSLHLTCVHIPTVNLVRPVTVDQADVRL